MKLTALLAATFVVTLATSAHADEATQRVLDDRAAVEQRRAMWLGVTGVAAGVAFTGLGTALLARNDGRGDRIVGTTLLPLGVVSFVAALFALSDNDHSALAARARSSPSTFERDWSHLADARATRRQVAGIGILAVSVAALAGAGYLSIHDHSENAGLEAAPLYAAGGIGAAIGVSMLAGRSETEQSWSEHAATDDRLRR